MVLMMLANHGIEFPSVRSVFRASFTFVDVMTSDRVHPFVVCT